MIQNVQPDLEEEDNREDGKYATISKDVLMCTFSFLNEFANWNHFVKLSAMFSKSTFGITESEFMTYIW